MWARWQQHLPRWPGMCGCAWRRPRGRQGVGILWVPLVHSTISATSLGLHPQGNESIVGFILDALIQN